MGSNPIPSATLIFMMIQELVFSLITWWVHADVPDDDDWVSVDSYLPIQADDDAKNERSLSWVVIVAVMAVGIFLLILALVRLKGMAPVGRRKSLENNRNHRGK